MTAAHEQNLTAAKRRSRFVTQAEMVGQKINDRSGKRKRQWDQIVKRIADRGASSALSFYEEDRAKLTAEYWKSQCQRVGIGVGLLSWFFWNFFLPYLIELAQNWIEAQQSAETSER